MQHTMSTAPSRLALIDALKAVASQFIVLHHLAFYGPMSDFTHKLWPALVTWLSQDARMAVQVFLVISGFLSARALAPHGVLRGRHPLRLVLSRYIKISLPYLAALLVAMVCTEVARRWMAHDSIPDTPDLLQFLAHALLLHSLLGMDALSAGVWYVAIDFQLFTLFVAVLWLARSVADGVTRASAYAAMLLLLALALGSLFYFNRDSAWDNWALYFVGAYALGAVACWASLPGAPRAWRWLLATLVLATVLALALDFRERIALALGVALLLGAAQGGGWLATFPRSRVLAYLGQISYSVFLLNFPIGLVVNAAFTRFAPADPLVQTVGVLLAWLACNVAGALFYHQVEHRLRRLG
jgi:peptidoglycan/LPS O-acetylase OafA/YrhL